jgi:hypothetical protein
MTLAVTWIAGSSIHAVSDSKVTYSRPDPNPDWNNRHVYENSLPKLVILSPQLGWFRAGSALNVLRGAERQERRSHR